MGFVLEIGSILFPLIIVSGIGIFVVVRMKHKYKKNTLSKKKSKSAQNLLDSLIPLGMMFGSALGIIISMFSPLSLLFTITIGAGLGLLIGYFAYEIYGKKEESY
ncbi:hypothetical protein PZE06_08970 [Robertmurraya sp. DFI.2.37]|uniref:sodium/proton-translocating pyrophosphatase n=1 Tax=Robertmurraya sp. DFI.2.37 TaxID=3031819 RepID=UPI001249143D|nr:sodium/proton-translocating pyrophosphatase [Robertmurraya sp. DFI.2.37]MDF1508318.1 hypothetical protein [Robertmurraya sp. DFI.2.37]